MFWAESTNPTKKSSKMKQIRRIMGERMPQGFFPSTLKQCVFYGHLRQEAGIAWVPPHNGWPKHPHIFKLVTPTMNEKLSTKKLSTKKRWSKLQCKRWPWSYKGSRDGSQLQEVNQCAPKQARRPILTQCFETLTLTLSLGASILPILIGTPDQIVMYVCISHSHSHSHSHSYNHGHGLAMSHDHVHGHGYVLIVPCFPWLIQT